ncbi:MAG: ParD-like family protein [Methylovulum sp.]|uniref:ParD-like family protein n=1 Tax=Methylovulum sp. TaxID=1916980 RepID=UPI00262DB8FC|nr:ParD-like family protein [Methylovulum sp.]MDD2722971.1 ParD-like family protein [Methylovulum sp.]MDD5123284.1 ParD-like family protein [Methylovulum sp.]
MTATISIAIDQELYEQAQDKAALEHRSTTEQIEFWAKLGRAALENPDLPISFIAESLLSLMEPHTELEPFMPRGGLHG